MHTITHTHNHTITHTHMHTITHAPQSLVHMHTVTHTHTRTLYMLSSCFDRVLIFFTEDSVQYHRLCSQRGLQRVSHTLTITSSTLYTSTVTTSIHSVTHSPYLPLTGNDPLLTCSVSSGSDLRPNHSCRSVPLDQHHCSYPTC